MTQRKYYVCSGCEAEMPDVKPKTCPLCGRADFDEIERDFKSDSEDEKYKKRYEEALKKLEDYAKDTDPEDPKYSFAD